MKIIIFTLLASTVVFSQDVSSHHPHYFMQPSHRTLEPAPARPEPLRRAGYTIAHGDAKSSVSVNLNSASLGSLFHQPESIQLGAEDVSGAGLQYPTKEYFQGEQYQVPQQSYLTDLATKQYLNINPNNAKPDIISQEQPQQLYNVGYSINIENNASKLTYRVPMPKNAHSYRQQKLLNAEVITGTNKDAVYKPSSLPQTSYDYAASNVQPSTNYIPTTQGKGQYTPALTKVYSEGKNSHGYTWKTLSPGVEISGYHSLDNGMSHSQQAQVQSFDHAAALGRSQGFDISNVVENGKNQYQPQVESQAYDINKALTDVSASNTQVANVETPDKGFENAGDNSGGDSSSIVDLKFDNPVQNSYHSQGGFSNQFKSGELSFNSAPFKHNLLSSGSNIEFDKSLFDGFYKNYNPVFYQPEVTLPSPNLPKNLHINLHGASSNQFPSYKFQAPHFQNAVSSNLNPHLQMINQHYAFAQASAAEHQHLPTDDVKPVTEQHEDSHGQQSQPQVQQVAVQVPNQPNIPIPNFPSPNFPSPNFKEQKGNTEFKKYNPQTVPVQIPVRQYGRPGGYVNDKNHRVKTSLRPPPMIIVHQKY